MRYFCLSVPGVQRGRIVRVLSRVANYSKPSFGLREEVFSALV
jgi:hypothetical protein